MKNIKLLGMATAAVSALLVFGGVARAGEIHDAVQAGNLEKVRALLQATPGLVNDTNVDYCETPLHLATSYSKKAIAELLLASGAGVNARDGLGQTPLHIAVGMCGSKEVTALLLDRGAGVNIRMNGGDMPLHVAATGYVPGTKDVISMLLAKGADINALDGRGETPLHIAVHYNKKEAVEALLAHGADVTVKNLFGLNPSQLGNATNAGIIELFHQTMPKAAGDAMQEGLVAVEQQQWTVAIRSFLKAQEATPTAPEVLFNLGLAESKVPGRELRAMAWFQAYLLSTTNAAHADAVHKEIAKLKVRVEGNLEKLLDVAKRLAAQSSAPQSWETLWKIAKAQVITGDIDAAKQTCNKGRLDFNAARTMIESVLAEIKPPPSLAGDHLTQMIKLVKTHMNTELFTDLPGALQTITAEANSQDMLLATVDAMKQIAYRLNEIQQLGR